MNTYIKVLNCTCFNYLNVYTLLLLTNAFYLLFTPADLPVIVTRAHIRKWIHERDLGKLEKLMWAGHGERLLMETSASPRVRSFLESVPYVMVNEYINILRDQTY